MSSRSADSPPAAPERRVFSPLGRPFVLGVWLWLALGFGCLIAYAATGTEGLKYAGGVLLLPVLVMPTYHVLAAARLWLADRRAR